jgi:adenylate dimethylallyltransferase (cytokinin synthase)
MGATGTGKSRLAVDLALRFNGEVINSDKMQIHAGLNIVTNKVTTEECKGVPHHLLCVAEPDTDFSASDFCREAFLAADMISHHGRLPIIAGGSNSYVEELVDGGHRAFRKHFDCCFLWVEVRLPVLHSFVSERVDRMVERGLVEEVKDMFNPCIDYKKGIRRAIGLPEMDQYLRSEGLLSSRMRSKLLEDAIKEIKANTCSLASRQLAKIHQLCMLPGWGIHQIDATEIFQKKGKTFDMDWYSLVEGPSIGIVREFLQKGRDQHEKRTYKTRKNLVHKIVLPEGSSNRIRCKQASTGTLVSVGTTV